MTEVTVLYFAAARDATDLAKETYILPTADTRNLIRQVLLRHPALSPLLASCVLAVNQEYAHPAQVVQLQFGDEVAFIPPLSGG